MKLIFHPLIALWGFKSWLGLLMLLGFSRPHPERGELRSCQGVTTAAWLSCLRALLGTTRVRRGFGVHTTEIPCPFLAGSGPWQAQLPHLSWMTPLMGGSQWMLSESCVCPVTMGGMGMGAGFLLCPQRWYTRSR